MAFNFRPKSTDDIISRKKKNSLEASMIYEVIMKKYGETIVLDLGTQFQKIKIPRVISDNVTIRDIKNHLKFLKIDLTGIDLSFGNGSGNNTGTDAVATAQQENCTKLYCQVYMDKGKFPKQKEVLKIYPKVDDEWTSTFESQAKSIVKWIGSKGYEFSRDENGGIMTHLESIALKKCGVGTKDSWNPADIYAVKKTSKKIIMKDLEEIGKLTMQTDAKLDRLNEYMRSKLSSKELIGISLKKLNRGIVKVMELTNATTREESIDIGIVPNSIQFDLDLNNNNEFNTGEMSFKLNVKGSIVATQIRAFSGGVRESTQMDMTGVGQAAKLGKVSSREAIDPFLRKIGLNRTMGSKLPKVGSWTEQDIQRYILQQKKIERVKISGQSIYWGKNPWESTLREAISFEQDIDRTASQLSAKLQCFGWVEILNTIEKKGKLEEFLTVLYYGAKKEYASAGPFLKVA